VKQVNNGAGNLVLSEAEVADSFWKRFRGLMLRRKFPRGGTLLFKFKKPGRYSIHMFFMWFPIDLVYLDPSFRVVETRERLKPWRVYRPKNKSQYLLELPAGTISGLKIKIGQKIPL
jgi:hypothetical protein